MFTNTFNVVEILINGGTQIGNEFAIRENVTLEDATKEMARMAEQTARYGGQNWYERLICSSHYYCEGIWRKQVDGSYFVMYITSKLFGKSQQTIDRIAEVIELSEEE